MRNVNTITYMCCKENVGDSSHDTNETSLVGNKVLISMRFNKVYIILAIVSCLTSNYITVFSLCWKSLIDCIKMFF